MWGPICRLNLINCIQTIWVDIQLYYDQNPKIAVYRNKYNIHQTQKVCKENKTKKQTKLLNNLQNDQAVYKYISTIVEKLLDRIFAMKVM